MCGTTGARGFRIAEDLPQLPRLPSAGCSMEGPRRGGASAGAQTILVKRLVWSFWELNYWWLV